MTPTRSTPVTRARRLAASVVALLLGTSWLVAGSQTADAAGRGSSARACAKAPHGFARCDMRYRTTSTGAPATTAARTAAAPNFTPAGYGPDQLQDAYNLPSDSAGVGRVIAIIDAYDLPEAESVLGHYRTQFGLPPCTTANGCFLKVNQAGNPSPLPPSEPTWGLEIALDLDMVSASCPNCAIVLVEANNALVGSLAQAAAEGASLA